jgi:hypothetical protein
VYYLKQVDPGSGDNGQYDDVDMHTGGVNALERMVRRRRSGKQTGAQFV